MDVPKNRSAVLLAFVCLLCLAVAGQENLLPDGPFLPMRMNGEVTGLKHWGLLDYRRIAYMRDRGRGGSLLDGRDIFLLDCQDGVFSVKFKDDAPGVYYQYGGAFHIYPDYAYLPSVPAENYRAVGEFFLDKGAFTCFGGRKFGSSAEWQRFDYEFPPARVGGVSLDVSGGASFAMRNFRLLPQYSRVGGAIGLPDGGELTSLAIPKDAPYLVRRLVLAWRGWLWHLTGTALPIREQGSPAPQKGCLAFMPGDVPNNGYELRLDSRGGLLVYGWPFAINMALFNYLREYAYVEYDRNNRAPLPGRNSVKSLLPTEARCIPRYGIHTESGSYTSAEYAQGTVSQKDLYMGVADWYAMPLDTISHMSNQLMPPPAWRRAHPECQMMSADGKRQTTEMVKHIQMLSPCLTEPFGRKYMLDRIADLVRARDDRRLFSYALGDLPDAFCQCPLCRAANEDKTCRGYASVFFDFMGEAALMLQREFPDVRLDYCAYHTYAVAPPGGREIPANVVAELCLGGMKLPCNLHLDCEMNRAAGGLLLLKEWCGRLGRERTGVTLYDEHNPFMLIDILAELSRHSSSQLHLYTFSMIEQYVAARWNQGDSPEGIVREYNTGVFGEKAGEYVTEAQRLVYEYDKAYRHVPGEFTGGPGRMRYMESLDRVAFDSVYALLDKAEAAIRASQGDLAPLLWEKFTFMTADLRKYPRSSHETDEELKAFAYRVAEFMRISDILTRSAKYPYLTAGTDFTVWHIKARDFLARFCGLCMSNTKKYWTEEKEAQEFLRNPVGQMAASPEHTRGHWRFASRILRGGENGQILRRASSGRGRIAASLVLENPIQGKALLTIAGWDDEKPGKTTFRVLVNGTEIFSGANAFPETADPRQSKPGYMYFPIAAGLLKRGENQLALENTTPDDPAKAIRVLKNAYAPEDGYAMRQDYFWGWLAVDELRVTVLDDEYRNFAHGRDGTAWSVFKGFRPLGTISRADGTVTIRSGGAKLTGIVVALEDSKWVLPQGVRFKMRVVASGKGTLNAGFMSYPSDAQGNRLPEKMQYSLPKFALTEEPAEWERVLTQKCLGYCCPFINVENDGFAVIHDFSLEAVPDNE
ncbi:MAG: DUF4838 domain-containing protein [Victivallales bacterium]|nr:DUF4838 domain-containing protein [Victivallales bacterium]